MHALKFSIVIVLMAFPICASGRIDETVEQCKERYGEIFSVQDEGARMFFRRGGLIIGVDFYQGKAESMYYRKQETDILDRPVKISDNEIEILLNVNGGDRKWRSIASIGDKGWQTEDGELLAYYFLMENYLTISKLAYLDRAQEKKRLEEEKKLEGF